MTGLAEAVPAGRTKGFNMELLYAPQVEPFVVVLIAIFGIVFFELICILAWGAGVLSLADGLRDIDAEARPRLDWILIKEAPTLAIVTNVVTMFGIGGLGAQLLAYQHLGNWLPPAAGHAAGAGAAILSHLALCWAVRRFEWFAGTALSPDDYIGKPFLVVSETAEHESFGEAKWVDMFEQPHYILLGPENAGEVFMQGEVVFPTVRIGDGFFAIRPE